MRYSAAECFEFQRRVREKMFADGLTLPFGMAKWFRELSLKKHPFVHPEVAVAAPIVIPVRPVVTEHRVKRHVFADGTIWESCTATGCGFSTTTGNDRPQGKRHAGGAVGIFEEDTMPYVEETADGEGVEVSPDDTSELSLEGMIANVRPVSAGDFDENDSNVEPVEPAEVDEVEDEASDAE